MDAYARALALKIAEYNAEQLRRRAARTEAALERIKQYKQTGDRLRAIERFSAHRHELRYGPVMRRFEDYRYLTDKNLRNIFTPQGIKAFNAAKAAGRWTYYE